MFRLIVHSFCWKGNFPPFSEIVRKADRVFAKRLRSTSGFRGEGRESEGRSINKGKNSNSPRKLAFQPYIGDPTDISRGFCVEPTLIELLERGNMSISPEKKSQLIHALNSVSVSSLFHFENNYVKSLLNMMIEYEITVEKHPNTLPILGKLVVELDHRIEADSRNNPNSREVLSLLATLGLKYLQLMSREQSSLLRLLKASVEREEQLALPVLISFFSLLQELKVDWAAFPLSFRKKILVKLNAACYQRSIGEEDMGTLSVALARLDVSKSNSFPPDLRSAIFDFYQNILRDGNQPIRLHLQTLNTFSRLGFTVRDIVRIPQLYSLLEQLWLEQLDIKDINQEEYVRFLRSLGNLKFDFTQISPAIQQKTIYQPLLLLIPSMKLQTLAIVLGSLVDVNCTATSLPKEIQSALSQSIADRLQRLSAMNRIDPQSIRDVSIIIFTMGELGFSVSEHRHLFQPLMNSVKRLTPQWDGMSLTTSLHGLGKLGFRWKQLSSELQSLIDSRLVQVFSQSNLQVGKKRKKSRVLDISWLLSSCQILQYRSWLSVGSAVLLSSSSLRKAVLQQLTDVYNSRIHSSPTLEEIQGIPHLIFLLSTYGMFHQSFPESFQHTVFQMINLYCDTIRNEMNRISLDAKEISRLSLGLANLQYAWKDIPPQSQRRLIVLINQAIPRAEEQSLLNMLFALTLLCFDEEKLDSRVVEIIHKLILREQIISSHNPSTNVEQAAQTQLAISLTWLQTLPNFHPVIRTKELMLPNSSFPSKLHRFFSKELKEFIQSRSLSNLQVWDEYHGLPRGVFPMDIAIIDSKAYSTSGGNEDRLFVKALIEIDGELSHDRYQTSDSGLLLSRVDALKDYLYRHYFSSNRQLQIRRIPSTVIANHHERRKVITKILTEISSS